MTFLVCLWNGLNFFELFKLYFHLGLITTPHVFYVHMTYVYFFHVSFFTRLYGQEKSLLYYDLFDFGVLLYGCTPTLIFFYFFYNPTTPILPIYVDQRQTNLEKDTTRPRRMVIQQIPTVPRGTIVAAQLIYLFQSLISSKIVIHPAYSSEYKCCFALPGIYKY